MNRGNMQKQMRGYKSGGKVRGKGCEKKGNRKTKRY